MSITGRGLQMVTIRDLAHYANRLPPLLLARLREPPTPRAVTGLDANLGSKDHHCGLVDVKGDFMRKLMLAGLILATAGCASRKDLEKAQSEATSLAAEKDSLLSEVLATS